MWDFLSKITCSNFPEGSVDSRGRDFLLYTCLSENTALLGFPQRLSPQVGREGGVLPAAGGTFARSSVARLAEGRP